MHRAIDRYNESSTRSKEIELSDYSSELYLCLVHKLNQAVAYQVIHVAQISLVILHYKPYTIQNIIL